MYWVSSASSRAVSSFVHNTCASFLDDRSVTLYGNSTKYNTFDDVYTIRKGVVRSLFDCCQTTLLLVPLVMVTMPVLFYIIVWLCGSSIEEIHGAGWVGDVSPTVPITDLLHIVVFDKFVGIC